MEPEDLFREWQQRRRRPEVPEGFAERVLASIREDVHRSQALPAQSSRTPLIFHGLFASRPARAAIFILAGLACLFRMISFLALLIPG